MPKKSEIIKKSVEIGGSTLEFEVGRFASQTNAAVIGRYGDTMILVTVVMGNEHPDLGYFPLYVEYQEKLYAGGRIKGSRWVKREGRPSDEAILNARLVDRSIRPLFPENFSAEVQVVITVFSVDSENDPDIVAINTASAALAVSDIPWNGPVASARLGFISKKDDQNLTDQAIDNHVKNTKKTGNFMVNPTYVGREYSDLDLIVSSTEDSIVMIEAGANEVSENEILEAFQIAQTENQKLINTINELSKAVGAKKIPMVKKEVNNELTQVVKKQAKDLIAEIIDSQKKGKKQASESEIIDEIATQNPDFSKSEIKDTLNKIVKEKVRETVLKTGSRIDGRKSDEIRTITCDIGLLPRTHGSGMFKRGETQVLTITTLAAPSLEQWIESMEGEGTKRYIHHYYMPPYSVGETGRFGWPSRREVGHGALAERALEPMIPTEENFPYTIRVVSEILSSNGSTSMASVCGSTLSLMDAGVPLKKPVAGIAMGLIAELKSGDKIENYQILSDIQGMEDHIGDMDFKVAGTRDGITAIQMDVKTKGITKEILSQALEQARQGRLYILEKMLIVLPAPRAQLSRFAPKVEVVKISPEQIGDVIGPGGRVIRQIMRETDANLEVDDDGTITISGADAESLKKAVDWVKSITRKVQPEEEFDGTVKRIEPFGAFVEILPGKEGLLHVSKMAEGYVASPSEIVKIGDTIKVKVDEIDDLGRINLSVPGINKKRPERFDNRQKRGRDNRNKFQRRLPNRRSS